MCFRGSKVSPSNKVTSAPALRLLRCVCWCLSTPTGLAWSIFTVQSCWMQRTRRCAAEASGLARPSHLRSPPCPHRYESGAQTRLLRCRHAVALLPEPLVTRCEPGELVEGWWGQSAQSKPKRLNQFNHFQLTNNKAKSASLSCCQLAVNLYCRRSYLSISSPRLLEESLCGSAPSLNSSPVSVLFSNC